MHPISVLTTLVMSGFCAAATESLEEPAFGIEFSTENIMISFVSSDGHAKGLATVKGDIAYQDLMISYYELCFWAHDTQLPPGSHWDELGYADAAQTLLELEVYHNGSDVDILAKAVGDVKRAAADALTSQYNITMPEQPLVAIATPSYMWTTIEPEPRKGGLDLDFGPAYDAHPSNWHRVFELKMSGAVQRAGFRREVVDGTNTTVHANECLHLTSPIAPAGYAAFWNPNFQAGGNATAHYPAAIYITQYEGPPAVVVDLTNATLSFWAQQKNSLWSPWGTIPQLGAHHQFEDFPVYMHETRDPVWGDVVIMIRKLRKFMAYPDGEVLRVYLTGDAWQEEMVNTFILYLYIHKHTTLQVDWRGMFAASDGAVSIARGMLDACGPYSCRA